MNLLWEQLQMERRSWDWVLSTPTCNGLVKEEKITKDWEETTLLGKSNNNKNRKKERKYFKMEEETCVGFGIMELLSEAVGLRASWSVNTIGGKVETLLECFAVKGNGAVIRGDQRSIGASGCGDWARACLFSRWRYSIRKRFPVHGND